MCLGTGIKYILVSSLYFTFYGTLRLNCRVRWRVIAVICINIIIIIIVQLSPYQLPQRSGQTRDQSQSSQAHSLSHPAAAAQAQCSLNRTLTTTTTSAQIHNWSYFMRIYGRRINHLTLLGSIFVWLLWLLLLYWLYCKESTFLNIPPSTKYIE